MTLLPSPKQGQANAVAFVDVHLRHVSRGEVEASLKFSGGQSNADAALADFDVSGYAASRNEVYPQPLRGASALSPFIRHGLLPLRRVWEHVSDGPTLDVEKFRDELMWQEFARHWYARLGVRTRAGIEQELKGGAAGDWDRSMACMELTVDELEEDGWLVNQTRKWLASEWSVRRGFRWQDGEDYFFRHLLDGSRAANRLGWQLAIGVGPSKPFGFTRWQVEKRAKSLCASCDLVHACPIEEWAPDPDYSPIAEPVDRRSHTPESDYGPSEPAITGAPDAVWLTAESLGLADPALVAHPHLPAVFVFDELLLAKLQLSPKRLIFLTETLAEIAATRPLEVHLGSPALVLDGRSLAATFAPVPGFRTRTRRIKPAALHPWPWLVSPGDSNVTAFRDWKKSVTLPR